MPDSMGRGVGHDAVATLKHLALLGAVDGEAKLSSADLATRLSASAQTASRRLKHLEEVGHVEREIVGDGQWVSITDTGEHRLRAEYDAYRRIFESPAVVELRGTVTSGMGEGRHYITLSGYMRQFRERLGYEPFPGTLNVGLGEESVRERSRLGGMEPVEIEGWEDDERTYGPAYCYPAAVHRADADGASDDEGGEATDESAATVEDAHVIAPERTHHGEDQLEVIAPVKLRDALDLEDDDEVIVRVAE